MFVLGSGGHMTRGLLLSQQLNYDQWFVVPYESELTKQRVGSNYSSVLSPRFRAKDNILMTAFRTVLYLIYCLFLFAIIRPVVLISTGSGITVPPFLLAGLFGIKTVYIESPSRVHHPSITGKFLLGKVDLWFSSWSELTTKYHGAKYGGQIY
jgi:UDP-N-acetylglucosamine:LPS N-acetylglucosamine transferase